MRSLKFVLIVSLVISLSGFTGFVEKAPPLKGVPKRTEDKTAGIVIPSFDAKPYDIIEKSYDRLDAFMYNAEKGIFMALSTSNFDLTPHKLTFYHEKFGFVTHSAYRVDISFFDKKSQKMDAFSFAPFEITSGKSAKEVLVMAEEWGKFFESQGWKRMKDNPQYPLRKLPSCEGQKQCSNSKTYMRWEDGEGLQMAITFNVDNYFDKEGDEPKYSMEIVFSNKKLIQEVLDRPRT